MFSPLISLITLIIKLGKIVLEVEIYLVPALKGEGEHSTAWFKHWPFCTHSVPVNVSSLQALLPGHLLLLSSLVQQHLWVSCLHSSLAHVEPTGAMVLFNDVSYAIHGLAVSRNRSAQTSINI